MPRSWFCPRGQDQHALVDDSGFTLIELMVVLLILAILLAIAIPTFLGVTKSANDRAAQSNLNTATVNAKAGYQAGGQSYSGVTTATLAAAEPGLTFTANNSASQGQISMWVDGFGNAIVLASYSKSFNCWYQIDNPGGNAQVAAPFAANFTQNGGGAIAKDTPTAAVAGLLTFPSTQAGKIYVEVKGDTNAGDCKASTPTVGATVTQVDWSSTAFPSL